MEQGDSLRLTPTGFSLHLSTKLPIELSNPKFVETKASNFLEQQRRDPFVLSVSFFEPHPPYDGPLNGEHPLDQSDLDATRDHIFQEQMPLRYRLRQKNNY